MINPDHISECAETIFGVKILKFFEGDPGSGKDPDFGRQNCPARKEKM
jgi:hypothetical protein